MKQIFIFLLLLQTSLCFSQYVGVKARYTETRLVDDFPNPPIRENRLILSFYDVSATGVLTPAFLSNYDLWVYKSGLQYGNLMGGVLDSTGNNYDGYAWTAPKVVAYNNSHGINYIDCDPNVATHYIVNGHELDCGFVSVSYWYTDEWTGNTSEAFTAPNVCLNIYANDVNFNWTMFAGPPYNFYSVACAGGNQYLVIRGLLGEETGASNSPLTVRFSNVNGAIEGTNLAKINWSNLTEADIDHYEIQRASDNNIFKTIDTIAPLKNNGDKADYKFFSLQADSRMLYRIKAVETTGKIIYSNVISLKLSDANSPVTEEQRLSVYPNPVTDGVLTLRLTNAEKGHYIMSIINEQGLAIKQKMINHNGGDIAQQLDLTGVPPGTYQCLLRSATKKYSQTIVYVY